MAAITGILCQVLTGNFNGAGTDGRVYLGLGGREFRLDSTADDFERGSIREYILGLGPVEPNLPPPQIRVNNAERNDPRVGFPLDTVNLSRSPIYLRFEPEGSNDNWNVSFAAALVFRGTGQFVSAHFVPEEFDNLWMGAVFGKALFLTNEFSVEPQSILDKGRALAARAAKGQPEK